MYLDPTQTSSTHTRQMRAIQGRMDTPARKRPNRVRPLNQSAQVIMRMGPEQRDVLDILMEDAGDPSRVAYLLRLAARDAAQRGMFREADVLAGMVGASAEGPDPVGQTPHAEADRAVTAAAG